MFWTRERDRDIDIGKSSIISLCNICTSTAHRPPVLANYTTHTHTHSRTRTHAHAQAHAHGCAMLCSPEPKRPYGWVQLQKPSEPSSARRPLLFVTPPRSPPRSLSPTMVSHKPRQLWRARLNLNLSLLLAESNALLPPPAAGTILPCAPSKLGFKLACTAM